MTIQEDEKIFLQAVGHYDTISSQLQQPKFQHFLYNV